MIPDDTFLGELGLSARLYHALRNRIPYDDGDRELTFGNAKKIPFEVLSGGPNFGTVTQTEWRLFLEAGSVEEAQRGWRNKIIHLEIEKRERALVNYKRGVETQERKLAELRAQLKGEA
jgi:hypothetical protein